MMTNEMIESDAEAFDASAKGSARRRVDAYHEVAPRASALRELEQPFVLEARAWPPPRY